MFLIALLRPPNVSSNNVRVEVTWNVKGAKLGGFVQGRLTCIGEEN